MIVSRPPAHPTTRDDLSGPARFTDRPGTLGHILLASVALWLSVSAAFVPASWAGASQATPDAARGTPGSAVECGVPLETTLPTPVASPVASPVGAGTPQVGAGTPAADVAGTPTAIASPIAGADATARDLLIGTDVERVSRALVRCLADGDYAAAARLVTPEYRGTLAGSGEPLDPETFIAILEGLTTTAVEIRSVSAVTVDGEDRATAEIVTVVAGQLFRARWFFSLIGPDTGQRRLDADQPEPNRRWVVSAAESLEVKAPAGAAAVEVTLAEYSITLDPETAPGPDLVLEITNDGEFAHEVVVLRVAEGASVDALLYQSGPTLPDGLAFVGQVPVEAGDEARMVLVGLEPGTYALVDLSPDPTGALNLAQGMRASLVVED